MTVAFVIPCYNAGPNLRALFKSLKEQTDNDWCVHIVDDMSTDETREVENEISKEIYPQGCEDPDLYTLKMPPSAVNKYGIPRLPLSGNFNRERKYALRNIVESVTGEGRVSCYVEPSDIVAVIDGDDQLCNSRTVELLHRAYDDPEVDVAWTAHRWDINGMNISREMPQGVNPYQYPWCSSHLKTFRASLLRSIPTVNFKDHRGEWFQRGYDQALMLPLIFKARKRLYIPDVCYQYNIKSCSVDDRDWAEMKQLRTVNMVRARGFIDG